MGKINKFILVILIVSVLSSFIGCSNNVPFVNNGEKIKNLKVSKSDSNDEWLKLNLYFDGSVDEKKAETIKEERLINKEELIGEI